MKTCNHNLLLRGFREVPESKISKLYFEVSAIDLMPKNWPKNFTVQRWLITYTSTQTRESKPDMENVLLCNV